MQNRYNVEPSEDGLTYTFTTRYDIKYHLALTTYQIGEVSAFSLSLYPDEEPQKVDYWIKNTVIKVIGDILNKESNVIFYICDSDDDRQDKRHLIFDYWYQKSSEHFYYISKYNHCFKSEHGYQINSSVLYNNQNPLDDFIIEEFKKALEYS
ncbi:DUF6169 family protein [Mucilaginibacter paludis]|uniref:Uncharacterized protein n=1 Tax=Mucilaginibacter paludis DSM 18603 TaxID=714943 RepID=H1YAY2_9SPHI|nr:DUF6169 family protein [Mucilaginibacter paludis]EHQ30015.1 hypothetical protein Mucpa_5955 [Mucilaginibacter paludis DSM 18603]